MSISLWFGKVSNNIKSNKLTSWTCQTVIVSEPERSIFRCKFWRLLQMGTLQIIQAFPKPREQYSCLNWGGLWNFGIGLLFLETSSSWWEWWQLPQHILRDTWNHELISKCWISGQDGGRVWQFHLFNIKPSKDGKDSKIQVWQINSSHSCGKMKILWLVNISCHFIDGLWIVQVLWLFTHHPERLLFTCRYHLCCC